MRAVLLALLLCGALAAQDAETNKARVTQRGAADTALVLPQLGLGGEATDTLAAHKYTTRDWKPAAGDDPIDAVWCIPDGADKSRKLPLLVSFHGDGGNARGQAGSVARASTKEDPVFVASVGWQNSARSLRGGTIDGFVDQVREMIADIGKEFAIDENRVFLQGFSAGVTVAEWYIAQEWEKQPQRFMVRAAFMHSKGFDPGKQYPPIPFIQTVGEKEDNFYGRDQRGAIRQMCNSARQRGVAVTYHEIPGRGHELAPRVHQIVRDHIQAFGGPGCDVYKAARGAQEAPEPLPFTGGDAYVNELIELCRADNFAGALKRAEQIDADKEIKSKDKREAKKFPKEIEKYARKALPELEERIKQAMKEQKLPPPWAVRRMRALLQAYADQSWVTSRKYTELLQRLDTGFEPAAREREREQLYLRAQGLETDSAQRGEARKLYEELAARAAEDGGASVWPSAAAYRLLWWT